MGTEQNTVAPGKRPLSSMSPTLVLKEGKPYLAVGASGGPTIITGTLLALIRTLDWHTSPAEAIALPRIHHQWLPNEIVAESMPPAALEILKRRGHKVTIRDAYNSVQMVIRKADGTLVGVSDPRKFGQPAGAKK
jgi:gamma-glutamyltranspeptidase/glutathione hydrolase